MFRWEKPFITIAGLHVVLILALLACGSAEEPNPVAVPEGAQNEELIELSSCDYKLGDNIYAADCGALVVPENREDSNSRLIALPITRIRANAAAPEEPIFWLGGGPGKSNMRFTHQEDLEALTTNHDIVMVGYRGMDGSEVLDCPEISQALRSPPGDLLSDDALESYSQAGAQCADRLQEEGFDLAGYTMTETINDMEAARKALGYELINLLGASYGTRLAMIYEWMYPDSLRRVVMAAVNPPGHFVWDAQVIDTQIDDYARLCALDSACGDRTDDLAETIRDVSQNMPSRWLLFPIDEDTVKLFTFIMLTESIRPPGDPIGVYGPAAVDMWLAAEEGDASGMALVTTLRNMFLPNFFNWGHLLAMGGSTDEYADPNRDYRSEFEAPDTILGSPMSQLILAMGSGWPVHLIPEEYLHVQPSDVETLLVGGSVDLMNPPQAATEELLPNLSNGQQVILEEFGHGNTFWNSQPVARLNLLATFFNSGEVDDSLYVYQPLDFDVGRGWPGLAKIVLTIVVLVAIVLVTLVGLAIWLVVRRRRRSEHGRGSPHRGSIGDSQAIR